MRELYIKEGCPYCREQMKELERENLTYRLYNVGRDRSALEAARGKYGANMVPVLVEGGEVKSIGYRGKG
ncbi:MAG: glutaredoxin family protein [Firmicutes bacterium]|nr:glutaredoxin family protein [Bacillota bacterium]